MCSSNHNRLARLTTLSILVALSCGRPATSPAGMVASHAFDATTGNTEVSANTNRSLIDRSSRSKCSSPPRPLFRPEYGNR